MTTLGLLGKPSTRPPCDEDHITIHLVVSVTGAHLGAKQFVIWSHLLSTTENGTSGISPGAPLVGSICNHSGEWGGQH
jgi:hypothetical protein